MPRGATAVRLVEKFRTRASRRFPLITNPPLQGVNEGDLLSVPGHGEIILVKLYLQYRDETTFLMAHFFFPWRFCRPRSEHGSRLQRCCSRARAAGRIGRFVHRPAT